MKRPGLAALGVERSFSFDKSRNTGVENFNQPIRDARSSTSRIEATLTVELLPVDVLILSIKQALPRNSASFMVSARSRAAR